MLRNFLIDQNGNIKGKTEGQFQNQMEKADHTENLVLTQEWTPENVIFKTKLNLKFKNNYIYQIKSMAMECRKKIWINKTFLVEIHSCLVNSKICK